MKDSSHWKKELGLEPHPEGGWYRRVFESDIRLENGRPAMTSIYYLLEAPDFSALHRLKSDEQWHFYYGRPITLHELDAGGIVETTLGAGSFQHTVKAGTLFGATVERDYALVGCTVTPGFEFSEFEMPVRDELLKKFPNQYEFIVRLSR
ncbi:cupin domain-containing protein [Pontiella agarivorans]|uniref:Cupin domain-containing protein n=1 Tax=Pontiella agarivorans TaxID=3038953 RepID=A0ABU5MX30_9BACT|nr:cupin domain-containing protein [Pontiella agarivorans]MDZ8118621.1 cupin domain-containing protein [Pontiella agarivorans]